MKAIDYSYFIEKYLAGEMEQQEKKWFEREIEGNELLLKEILLRKKTDAVLKRHDLTGLRNRLETAGNDYRRKEALKTARKKTIYRSAAVLAAMVMIGSLLFYISRDQSPGDFYSAYFSVYEAGGQARNVTDATADPIYTSAVKYYNQNDFVTAAALFRDYLSRSPENMEARLIYGVSEMKNERFPEAENSFTAILDNGNNYYLDNARWYLALCHLNTGKTESAVKELNAILESGSVYRAKAGRLLKKVR